MPSFAFWKSAKPDESKSPLLSDAAVKEELSVIIPNVSKAVDLDPGNQDSGVFLFDEDAQEIPGDETPVVGPASNVAGELISAHDHEPPEQDSSSDEKVEESLLDIGESPPHSHSPALAPEESTPREEGNGVAIEVEKTSEADNNAERTETFVPQPVPSTEVSSTDPLGYEDNTSSPLTSRPVSSVPQESGPVLSVEKKSTVVASSKVDMSSCGRDSGVHMYDNKPSPAPSRPSSTVSNDNASLRSRVSSLSKPPAAPPQRTNSIARLQRPAELNLGFNSAPDAAKPKSELDMRYDLIRNSKTQSKAALRSPTQLLQDRLNMSPKKKDIEEKVRVFTPPRATVNGCLLPGPGAQAEAFTSTSVRAKTEAGRRPAWWCKFDKLVVFDGIEHQANGEIRLRTRTSKGLTVARRLGDLETVVIPLDCAHCHEMLNRHEWKYDMRVCKRSVCWDCKERCKWEYEQERMACAATPRADANRERADSMLQEEYSRSLDLRKEVAV